LGSQQEVFRVMKCVRLVLDACAETLEALRLYPTDPYGERFHKGRERKPNSSDQFVVDNQTLIQHFDLSRNKSLRTLETTAESVNVASGAASDFFRTVLSTTTSPAPLDVVVVYRESDLGSNPGRCWFIHGSSPSCFGHSLRWDRSSDVLRYKRHFRLFREMHKVRDFRLVLCADVFDCMVEDSIRTLEHTLITSEVNGGLDYFIYKPLVISERRTPRTRPTDHNTGWSATTPWPGVYSVL